MPTFTIDDVAETAALDVIIAGEPVTSYTFLAADETITLSAHDGAGPMSLDELARTLKNVQDWMGLVMSRFAPLPSGTQRDYSIERKYAGGVTSFEYALGGVGVSEASYNHGNSQFTVDARTEHVISWIEFLHWINAWFDLLQELHPTAIWYRREIKPV